MFADIFPPENIIVGLESEDKDEVFEEMLEVIVSAQPYISRQEALTALKERENKMTTGIMQGIAVPHAISPSVKGVAGALGISFTGIDYDAMDKKPVHIVFMLLFDPKENEQHLQIMKQFADLLRHKDLCNALMQKKSPQEVYDAIRSYEAAMESDY
ncbi:PTS sugar transporter subunit IIA [Treponema parvum]|uniref:PTS sugar transporter subunit IIA n=1 Tax=Treponema parvum TaxID=138851 RepID=UPI001AEC0F3E|nr:PTS sugar transporter subunit IIA [Treponema parvum]QTQ16712.1 PTS sugar transporter subunit IIA [Treponema parvum]